MVYFWSEILVYFSVNISNEIAAPPIVLEEKSNSPSNLLKEMQKEIDEVTDYLYQLQYQKLLILTEKYTSISLQKYTI